MNEILHKLAFQAVTTPSTHASAALCVLQDVLLEQGLVSTPDGAFDWATREVRPKYLGEEGSWDVEIVSYEAREGYRAGPHIVVLFRREGCARVNAYVVKIQRTSLGWRYRFPPDAGIEPVLRAGRGRLETKKIMTVSGREFVRHMWSVR